jgi:tripartite-type tricarboxylate transporter receptor subunit TctC
MDHTTDIERRLFLGGAAALASAALLKGTKAFAQGDGWPKRPVRIIVPSGPGSAIDAMIRIVQPQLAANLGQPVVVENKPGADFAIGASYVARSAPDGYTLLLGSIPLTTNPVLKKVPYDILKDFTPIANICNAAVVIVVPRALGVQSLSEFIALAKKKPDELNFANAAVGSLGQINLALLEQETGIRTMSVVYPGQAASLVDLLANRVNFAMLTPIVALPHVRSGALIPLGFIAPKRTPVLPQVPTMKELGFGSVDVETWVGLLAPAGTPSAIVDQLNQSIASALQTPTIRTKLEAQGFAIAAPHRPEQFAKLIRAQLDRWPPLFKAANIKLKG